MNAADLHQAEQWLADWFPGRALRRVLLVNPPDADVSMFRTDTARRGRYPNYPPYGLAVLAEHLRKAGVEVRISNLNHEILRCCAEADPEEGFDHGAVWKSRLSEDIATFSPELIGVTCMFTMSHASFREVCRFAADSGIPVAIGGVHVSNDVERILDDVGSASLAFIREADVAFPAFIRVVHGEAPLADLRQVILNRSGNRLHFLEEALPDSDIISMVPAFDLLEVPEYSRYGTVGSFHFLTPPGTRLASVLSNRGCRGSCTFCSVRGFNGPGVRRRSVASVLDELECLRDRHGVGHISWLDDDLLNDPPRVLALFNGMVQRGLGLTWDATNGVIAAACTEEIVAAAAESGCIALNIGMESGNRQILRQVRKPGTVENFLKAAELLRRHEQIHASVFLMIGFPGETLSMILDTLRVATEMDLDWYRISQLQPLPGTPIYDAMVAQGLIQAVGTRELRFNGGGYGKQTDLEQGRAMASTEVRQVFAAIQPNQVPTPDQLTDLWFYLNYHLNFKRLFHENRPVKIRQQMANLRCLGDLISPENAFALYFLGVLQLRVRGCIEPGLLERLDQRLRSSGYWSERFEAFGLSPEDLRIGDFATGEGMAIPFAS